MFSAILAIMLLPVTDLKRSKGLQFRLLNKIAFYLFVANFLVLMQLGAKHVESPFIEFGQLSTGLYFAYFIFIVPVLSILENTLIDLSLSAVDSPSNKNYGYITNLYNIGKNFKDFFIVFLILIFITLSFLISVAFAESSDSEDNSSDEDSSSEEDNNSEKEDNPNKDSDEDSDEHRRRSFSMSDDLWSGDPKEIDTETIESFIEDIEDLLTDLDDDQDRERWEERKSELEEELSRRNNSSK